MRPLPVVSFIVSILILTACGAGGSDRKAVAGMPDTARADTVQAAERPVEAFTVALTGDIMLGTTYPDTMLPPDNGRALFRDVKDILASADLALGNLEGTFCDSVPPRKRETEHTYLFRTPPEFAARLKETGYDYLSMANNHTYDFGLRGVLSTERTLDRLGIKYSGIRRRAVSAVLERGGVRFGLCAFGHNGHTMRHQELATVREVLDSLRAMADIVVVSFHGGGEGKAFSHLPDSTERFLGEDRGSLRTFARFCIDHGADIVYGHGPHVVRCVEMYKDRFIAYSLGNFCTPYAISIMGLSGYAPVIVVRTDRRGRFLDGRIHPFIQRKGLGPRRDTTGVVVRQIRMLTDTDVYGGRLRISDDGAIVPVEKE